MAFGVNYLTLIQNAAAAVTGHTWTFLTPAPPVYLGYQLEFPTYGPAVMIVHGDQSAETEVTANRGKHKKTLHLLGAVPYHDANVAYPSVPGYLADLSNMTNDLENIVVNNRQLAGLTEITVQAVTFELLPFRGPGTTSASQPITQYACVTWTLAGLDRRRP